MGSQISNDVSKNSVRAEDVELRWVKDRHIVKSDKQLEDIWEK